MRNIYLSAHPDDAVLSCGGMIYDQCSAGEDVEVRTFFCGKPEEINEAVFTIRKEEDERAVKRLGATPFQYNFIDAIYRKDGYGGKRYESVFSPIHDLDQPLVDSMVALLEAFINPDDFLFCPLAVGEHIDHVLVRKACEELRHPIHYYVDFPYIEYVPDKLLPAIGGLISRYQYVSKEGLAQWLDAVCEYRSQNLYPNWNITRQKITEYWQLDRGIYLWRKE